MSMPKSVYPMSVEELLPKARELAATLGRIPSQNQVKAELHIGAPKATAVLKALQEDPGETTDPGMATRLHLVSDSAGRSESVSEPPSETASQLDSAAVGDSTAGQGVGDVSPQVRVDVEALPRPGSGLVWMILNRWRSAASGRRAVSSWPLLLLALPAFVAIWSGWVGLGGLTGFGIVHPLPGIADGFALNTAITLPVGVETYAAYALRVWLSGRVPVRARRFAKYSALGSLALGAAGQVAYHLMTAYGVKAAPWWITTVVACLPVAVLGMGAALAHLRRGEDAQPAA